MDLLTAFCTIFGFLHMIVFITVEYNKTVKLEKTRVLFLCEVRRTLMRPFIRGKLQCLLIQFTQFNQVIIITTT